MFQKFNFLAPLLLLTVLTLIGVLSYGIYYSIDKYITLKNSPQQSASFQFSSNFQYYLSLSYTWLAAGIILGLALKKVMQIRQEKEKMTLLKDDLPQNLIKMITKENFIQICKDHDKELKIKFQIEKNSILFEGLSRSIQYATERLNNFIGSLRKEKFQLDWYIVDFLNKRNDFIEEFLLEQKLNCIICIEEFSEATREMIPIEIVSIKPHTTQKCLDLIGNSFKSVKYEFHQNSEELISNLKFERFVTDKVNLIHYFLM